MKHRIALACLAIATLASAPALAKSHPYRGDARFDGENHAAIRMLKDRDNALQLESNGQRIGAVERERIAKQRQQIDDVIDDLKAGRQVSPRALDEALGYPYPHHVYGG